MIKVNIKIISLVNIGITLIEEITNSVYIHKHPLHFLDIRTHLIIKSFYPNHQHLLILL